MSVSAPNTLISSVLHSRTSAAICASIVSQPVPISAAPMFIVYTPSSLSFSVALPTSTPDMPDPCIAMPIPTKRALVSEIFLIGYFSSHLIISLTFARHLSSAQLVLTCPW